MDLERETSIISCLEVIVSTECSGDAVVLSDQACSVITTDTGMKGHVVSTICAKQSVAPADTCEARLGKLWDDVGAKDCSVSHASLRREAVCPVLEDSATKEEKVKAACSLQSRVSADTCEDGLDKMWEVVAER